MAKSKHIKLTSGKITSATVTTSQLVTTQKVTNATTAFVGSSKSITTVTMVWGYGLNGGLGLGNTTTQSSPVQLGAANEWSSISSGAATGDVAAIKPNGTLWTFGYNWKGGLGQGDKISRSSPTQVGALTTWLKASAGYHTAAIKTNGTLWTWGWNAYGQLGLGDTTDRSSPVQVGSLTDWAQVNVARQYTLAIKTDGTLWAWGLNNNGQLGLGDTTYRLSPTQVGSLTNWAKLTANNRGNGTGYVEGAIKTDGTLWLWGNGQYGQLGQGNTTNRSSPVQVGASTTWAIVTTGQFFTAAIKTDGTLWTWGQGTSGQLGDGTQTNRSSPVQLGSSTWSKIAATSGFMYGIKTDGTMWAWGENNNSISWSLLVGDTTNSGVISPRQLGTVNTWKDIVIGWGPVYYGSIGASAPGAPTIGAATATGATTATVAFTAPASNGNSTITSYTATSSPGGITGTLSQAGSGTITVSGLTATTAYTLSLIHI